MKVLNIFAIFAILAFSFAFVPAQYVESGLEYTETQLEYEREYATLVSIGGTEIMIINSNGKLVETPDEIYQILKSSVRAASGYDDAVADTNEILERLEDKRAQVQVQCYRYTGMDKFDCHDRESCILAAFSTPISSTAVNADGFWEYMLDYKTKNIELQNKLNELGIKLKGAADEQNAQSIIEKMDEISQVEYEIGENALFLTMHDENCIGFGARDCYEYCPKLNWSLDEPEFTANLSEWRGVSQKLSSIKEQDSRATNIYQRTLEWKIYLANRGAIFTTAKKNVSNADLALQNVMAGKDYQLINDSQMQENYAKWAIKVSGAKKLGDEGQFYNSINALNGLEVEGNTMLNGAKKNLEKIRNLKTKIKNINVTLEKTPQNEKTVNSLEKLKMEFGEFESSIKYPILVQAIDSLHKKAEDLEGRALVLFAKSQLDMDIEQPEQNETIVAPVAEAPGIKEVIAMILSFIRSLLPIEI